MQEAALRQQAVASTSGRACLRVARSRGRHVSVRAVQDFNLWQSVDLPSIYKAQNVVPGARTLATPRLDDERAFERLIAAAHSHAAQYYGALYSSVLGGITTTPGLMVIHADDHMVHQGHAVYDVIPLVGGTLYQLNEHIDRLLAAAEDIGVPPPMSEPAIKRVLLDTTAASLKLNGHVFVWLTAGRGSFGASTRECVESSLYAVVTTEWADLTQPQVDRTVGWRATATAVPPLPPYFGSLKSPSNLQGAVALAEAQGRGYDVALYVDEHDHVTGPPNASLAIITQDHNFVYAPFERAPPGVTIQTLAALIPENRDDDDLPIQAVEQRPITTDDLRGALEAMLVSSTFGVVGVTHLDEDAIADGRPGYMTMALQAVLTNDREPKPGSARHIPVPYGGITGMASQLM